ncbi:hypothetical protein [Microbacterium gorillae]|uniref:hypothetical protein n=1 Tax=Microbacterium gorillae TaxID=1231063 RepID=UPI003D9528AA
MSAESSGAASDRSRGDAGTRHAVAAGVSQPELRFGRVSDPARVDASGGDSGEQALLRRVFGPQPSVLDPGEAEVVAKVMRRRAADQVSRGPAMRDRRRLTSPPVDSGDGVAGDVASADASLASTVDESEEAVEAVVEAGPRRSLMPRALFRQRLRAAAVGAAAAMGVVGISVVIWLTSQPQPTVVLAGEPLTTGEVEDILDSDLNTFRGFDITDGVSFGEAYGVRVIGATLSNADYPGALECLWLLGPREFVMPLCSGARERPDYPRLLDIWRDGDAFTWNPTPSGDLRLIRISVQGDRLEMWEEVVDGSA